MIQITPNQLIIYIFKLFNSKFSDIFDCTGTLGSPQLLMHSGIGPKDHLNSLNINVIEDLPVGFNLQDHVSMSALTFLVNESVTIVEPRLSSNPAGFMKYLREGTGPLTIPGGAEALALVNTKANNYIRKTQTEKSKFEYIQRGNTHKNNRQYGKYFTIAQSQNFLNKFEKINFFSFFFRKKTKMFIIFFIYLIRLTIFILYQT